MLQSTYNLSMYFLLFFDEIFCPFYGLIDYSHISNIILEKPFYEKSNTLIDIEIDFVDKVNKEQPVCIL